MSKEVGEWDIPVGTRKGNVIGKLLGSFATEFKGVWRMGKGTQDNQTGKIVAISKYMKRAHDSFLKYLKYYCMEEGIYKSRIASGGRTQSNE